MRPAEQSLAPGAQEVAVAVEHHHRVLAAREDVDVVLAVHADRGDLAVVPAVGQLAPVLDHLVAMFAGANDDGHVRLPYAALACFLRRVPFEERQHAAQLFVEMFGTAPVLQHLDTRQQLRQFRRGHRRDAACRCRAAGRSAPCSGGTKSRLTLNTKSPPHMFWPNARDRSRRRAAGAPPSAPPPIRRSFPGSIRDARDAGRSGSAAPRR